MKPVLKVRFKICCIASLEEAFTAISYGASALGLVSEMPSGPGVIKDNLIKEIAESVPPPISTFLLTSKTDVREIIEQQKYLGTNAVQLVDELKTGTYSELKKALPGTKIIQVIHVNGVEAIDYALKVANCIDAILLDSGNPNLATKILGGTGATHNWEISSVIRKRINIPTFLAGGLNPANINSAIEKVNPFAVDVCSGVRTDGKLDEQKLKNFVTEIAKNN